ncbi:MAG TPA: hypothetical protein VFB81_06030, partial [Myxococcales bacterium]|nr:hypothetical protein [Myxococcales bacterium]
MINPFSSLFAGVSPSASSGSPSAAKPESAPKSSPSSAAPSSYFKDEFDLGKSKYWSDMQAGARRGPAEEAAGA